MILMINSINEIDYAVQNRVLVALHYGPLEFGTRKKIWGGHLKEKANLCDALACHR